LERIVFIGYHDAQWYVRVGKKQGDGTYDWGDEVSLALVNPKPRGQIIMRYEGVLEFAYIDENDEPQVLRGRGVALDGTGTWQAL
jgi:hypothetical protein